MQKNKRKVGAFYEEIAADYLVSQGVMILERNYRNWLGEIDLIGMTADGWLIFVEVKYRSTERSGSPLAAVDGRCRFDVVGINGDKICWIKNAFDFCQ